MGNHGTDLWRQENINEVTGFENGFLGEFNNARSNLAIWQANAAACTAAQAAAGVPAKNLSSSNFANWGLAGQVAVPITTPAFGVAANANFSSSAFVTFLNNGAAGSFANNLATTSTFMCNLAGKNAFPGVNCPGSAPAVGPYAANLFVANPNAGGTSSLNGAFRFYNGSQSTYNAFQVEVRRRFSQGFQLAANYSFSKSLTKYYCATSLNFVPFIHRP